MDYRWHHVLKGKFLHGKCNRRVDYLIHTLVEQVIPYYRSKQARQDVGFEGENLEVMKHRQVIRSSYEQYTIADIDIVEVRVSFVLH